MHRSTKPWRSEIHSPLNCSPASKPLSAQLDSRVQLPIRRTGVPFAVSPIPALSSGIYRRVELLEKLNVLSPLVTGARWCGPWMEGQSLLCLGNMVPLLWLCTVLPQVEDCPTTLRRTNTTFGPTTNPFGSY